VRWPADPALEWAPPGHGDLYVALKTSGMLETLLERGYRYAFVSNSDNLGAVLEPRVLAWMAREQIPFVAEAPVRTESDRKGGHLARRRDGGALVLRETSQIADEDVEAFEDLSRHRYFNANNLWIDLRALADLLDERGGVLGLPMIVNRKTVDPTDPSSPAVIQLETAMGAAVGVFEGARAIQVPRARFVPVKTTDDLLVLRSDAYRLGEGWRVELDRTPPVPPLVELDPRYFKVLREFDVRARRRRARDGRARRADADRGRRRARGLTDGGVVAGEEMVDRVECRTLVWLADADREASLGGAVVEVEERAAGAFDGDRLIEESLVE
jgi:UTP--glucose-1-phosphate uridylyltransferase